MTFRTLLTATSLSAFGVLVSACGNEPAPPPPAPTGAQEGAHIHGLGTLGLTLEGQTLSVSLFAPRANFVSASNDAPTEASLTETFSTLTLYAFNPEAGCVLQSPPTMEVKKHDHSDHDHEHDHDNGHTHDDADAEHAHEDGGDAHEHDEATTEHSDHDHAHEDDAHTHETTDAEHDHGDEHSHEAGTEEAHDHGDEHSHEAGSEETHDHDHDGDQSTEMETAGDETADTETTDASETASHDHDDHDHESEGGHADIDLVHTYTCDTPGALEELTVSHFQVFDGFESINVTYVTEDDERFGTLTADTTRFALR